MPTMTRAPAAATRRVERTEKPGRCQPLRCLPALRRSGRSRRPASVAGALARRWADSLASAVSICADRLAGIDGYDTLASVAGTAETWLLSWVHWTQVGT